MIKYIKILFEDFKVSYIHKKNRIILIDLLKFLAICLMVIYHTTYDLRLLNLHHTDLYTGFWFALPRIIVFLFLFSSGASLAANFNDYPKEKILPKIQIRFIKLATFSLIISLVTYIIFPDSWIYFGTLHCLCLATVIFPYFHSNTKRQILFIIIASIAYLVTPYNFDDWASTLSFQSMDFIAPIPWLIYFVLGITLLPWIKTFELKIKHLLPETKIINYVSQKALPIYLLHQIFIFGTLYLVTLLLQIK